MMMTVGVAESSSSVEAMAFNYFRFGLFVAVNNIWTLVAVATAAVSFWRFKLRPSPFSFHNFRVSTTELADESSSAASSRPVSNERDIAPPLGAAHVAECSDHEGVVGGRRRVYSRFDYDDVIINEAEEEEELVGETEEVFVTMHVDKTVRFDTMERLRLSDLGIYDLLDLRVLDGNVVKLWDSCRVNLSGRAILKPVARAAILCNDYQIYLKT